MIDRYKITLNKQNLSTSNIQIINSFFEVSNITGSNSSSIPFHFEFKQNKLSFIVISQNEIQELNNINVGINDNKIIELDKRLKQFNGYNEINKNEGFIIIESLIGNTLTFGNKKINNSDTSNNYGNSMTKEFNKFQMNYLFYNFKFLFSLSQTETFEIMIKCLEESNQPSTFSLRKNPKTITDSLFLKNEKIKLLYSIDSLKNSECQFLLFGDREIASILETIEKQRNKFINATTTINSKNNGSGNNDSNGDEIDKSILSVYRFLQNDSRI
ncbi:hypothetical protein RB653_008349 [Dictyostelium firmibasis]|uniref:Uncharacterized protein n=1 Tax=Dictyostelium firmibasis TaxID=79012 RepID=A0AAN7YTY0_9MYCE